MKHGTEHGVERLVGERVNKVDTTIVILISLWLLKFTFAITSNYFHSFSFSQFMNISELYVTQKECPDIIAESVGIQFTSL